MTPSPEAVEAAKTLAAPPYVAGELEQDTRAKIIQSAIDLAVAKAVKEKDEALADLFAMMGEGLLVRDISSDYRPEWALKQLGFVKRMAKCHAALSQPRKEGDEPCATQELTSASL